MAQCCNPQNLQPEQSGGRASIPSGAPQSWCRLGLFLHSNKNLRYKFTSDTTYRILNDTMRTMTLGAK